MISRLPDIVTSSHDQIKLNKNNIIIEKITIPC